MPRYIDADAFLKKIERYSLRNGTTLGKHSGVADEIIDILMAENTADVVPRSEYDDLKLEYAGFEAGVKSIAKNIKAAVAREIFEEIYEDCFDQFGYIDYNALAELKKKYTEGEK